MEIRTIETTSLGDRSYIVIDGTRAAVIDPQRDIDRILTELDRRGLTLTVVAETHLHNDYVTGGFELSNRTGATYVVPGGDQVDFDRLGAADGDEVPIGDEVVLRAVHTPGHTPHHLSYVAVDRGDPVAVFTGGSLLYGTVGRTDLISDDATDELTRAQYRSAHRLAAELPAEVSVHPTHGFGSFCSSASSSGSDSSTIADEQRTNIALTASDEDSFVETLLSGLTAYPRYYAHMADPRR
jgi:hydroxyacylglutathione hydrolase